MKIGLFELRGHLTYLTEDLPTFDTCRTLLHFFDKPVFASGNVSLILSPAQIRSVSCSNFLCVHFFFFFFNVSRLLIKRQFCVFVSLYFLPVS